MSFNLISKDRQSKLRNLSRGIDPIYSKLMKVIFFNPSDEKIYPAKTIAFSLESGSIGSSVISRLFGKIKLISSKEYLLNHEKIATPTELLNTVLNAISDFKYSNKEIVLSIPSSWVVFKHAVFPSSVKANIRNVITYELDRLTPFSSDDAYFDYTVIGDDGNSITVAIMSTRMSLIKPYIEELKMSDINVSLITSNTFGYISILNYFEHNKDKILINIMEDGFSTYTISSSNIIDYNRSIVGYKDETFLLDLLADQIKSSEKSLSNKHNISVYLTGSIPQSNFIERLRLKTTSQVSTLIEVLNNRKINLSNEILISSFGAGICLLRQKTGGYNLLSLGAIQKQPRPLLITILLFVILILLVIAIFVIPLKTEQKNLKKITAIINSKKEDLKKADSLRKGIEALQSDIETIEKFTNDSMSTLDIMKELTTIIPSTTWLTRIRITTKTIEIEGFAENTAGLLTKLEDSKYFKNVEFSAPSYRDHATKMERFTIKMQREDKDDKEKK